MRRIDVAVQKEGFGYKSFTKSVTSDSVADRPGSYFCDASDGDILVTINHGFGEEGHIINVKKIDSTPSTVSIQSIDGIDGCVVPVVLRIRHENLQIQFHNGGWYVL